MQDKYSYRATYRGKGAWSGGENAMAMVVVETKRSFIVKFSMFRLFLLLLYLLLCKNYGNK